MKLDRPGGMLRGCDWIADSHISVRELVRRQIVYQFQGMALEMPVIFLSYQLVDRETPSHLQASSVSPWTCLPSAYRSTDGGRVENPSASNLVIS